jgi:methyltransferase
MVSDATTRWLYLVVLVVVVAERLFELRLTRRNERAVRARGAVEAGAEHYPILTVLHGAFLVCCVLEVLLLQRPFVPAIAAISGAALVGTMALRYWAVSSLGDRWNTRVLVEPGVPAVTSGPYRFLGHPNYLAVVVEIAALPMLHTAWLTAILFTVLNAWMLRLRIAVEERALLEHGGLSPAAGASP